MARNLFEMLSQDGGRTHFYKNLRALPVLCNTNLAIETTFGPFNTNLSREATFSKIHLAGLYPKGRSYPMESFMYQGT
jgi:hypothetical protein